MTKDEMLKFLSENEGIIDVHTHVGITMDGYLTGAYPYGMSFEDLVIRMKLLGVSRSVVFPFQSSYYLREKMHVFGANPQISFSVFPYENENTRLFEEIYSVFPEYSDMALPFVMFDPSVKVAEQVEHLEKIIAEYPVYGMKAVTTYCKSFVTDFESKGAALKEFARKHNLPVLFHSSWLKDDIWANIADIIKIAENNPDLRICGAHMARFSADALEKAAGLPNCFIDSAALKIHCDLALMNNEAIPPARKGRFETDYSSPGKVLNDLAAAYPDTLIWGSDAPFYYYFKIFGYSEPTEFKLRANYDSEILALNALDAARKRKISYENTLKFLFGNR
ncbi:MAG: amidohydrolase family protein [Victivallaceae bacterium]|nr:amidohydrolase family protein [Victivallaceae bacterium]